MSLVLLNIVDGVATLTLNSPSERNVLSRKMVGEIIDTMDAIESNETVHAVVVTGAGSAFCAGARLDDLERATKSSLGEIYEGFLRIARSPLPTIAAVNGAAVGAGMNLALGCDVRIAARRARFDSRFLHIGIHPGGGHTWMMQRIAGSQAAMAAVVFGETLDGAEAERVGLVWKCVDDADLMSKAHALAARAATVPRGLLTATKRTILDMAGIATHEEAVERELGPQVWSLEQPWFPDRIAELRAQISKNPVDNKLTGNE
ncbi:MAG: enoyl-CoA hydratase [Actinomycetota bacterium]